MAHKIAKTQSRFISKNILYPLKRRYGLPAKIQRLTGVVNNVETGVQAKTYEVIVIKRAILLPQNTIRKFIYDLSFIAANKNFTYGAFFDNTSRIILIDGKDLQIELTPNDHIEIDGIRESIKRIEVFEHEKTGWIIATNKVGEESV